MKRMMSLIAGAALLGTAAYADEAKVEVKSDPDHKKIEKTTKTGKNKRKVKVESKSRRKANGGRVDKTETTQEASGPGLGNRSKTKVTETKERDAAGNVVREEKKVDK